MKRNDINRRREEKADGEDMTESNHYQRRNSKREGNTVARSREAEREEKEMRGK